MKYRAEIDGLRALAVIPVVLFHAGFSTFSGGYVGVDVFFVISGYLITHIILTELNEGKFTITKFYERRARRILPALFTVLLVSIPLAVVFLEPSDLADYSQSLVAVSLFSSNFLFWLESSYWGVASELKPLIHTWSLAVEEQYYVIFPLLLMLLWRFNLRLLIVSMLIIAVSSLLWAQTASAYYPEASFFLLPTRMWELVIGAIVALTLFKCNQTQLQQIVGVGVFGLLSVLGVLMVLASVMIFDADTHHPGFSTLLPTVGTALIILFAAYNNTVGRLLSQRVLVFIGLISYSLYLWHQLFFAITRHYLVSEPSYLLYIILSLLSVLCAYLSYLFIETPFRNREFISQKNIFIFSIIGTLFFISVGLIGHFKANDISLISSDEYFERIKLIRKNGKERRKIESLNHCHHVQKGEFKRLDKFFSNWSCTGENEEVLWAKRMAIFGDSHAADKAMMLRLNGIDFLQMGGTACHLLIRGNNRCSQLLKFFHNKAAEHKIETVLISKRLRDKELTPKYLQKLLNDWGERYKKVYLFSPMVEFPYWQKKYVVSGKLEFEPDYSKHEKFYHSLSKVNIPENVTIIETRKLFCDDLKQCSGVSDNGELLLTDSNHLSVYAAQMTGKKLKSILKAQNSSQNQ